MTRINGFELINPETIPGQSFADLYKVDRACAKGLLERDLMGTTRRDIRYGKRKKK